MLLKQSWKAIISPNYTHTHPDEIFPKMPTINMNSLPLPQVILISYNQSNKHIVSPVPSMVYL